MERAAKWVKRNPAVSGLLGAVAASLILGTAIAWAFALQAENNSTLAQKNEKTALKALERAEWLVYAGQINHAQREWDADQGEVARTLLDACRWDFRGWEHDYLFTLVNSNLRTLRGHDGAEEEEC